MTSNNLSLNNSLHSLDGVERDIAILQSQLEYKLISCAKSGHPDYKQHLSSLCALQITNPILEQQRFRALLNAMISSISNSRYKVTRSLTPHMLKIKEDYPEILDKWFISFSTNPNIPTQRLQLLIEKLNSMGFEVSWSKVQDAFFKSLDRSAVNIISALCLSFPQSISSKYLSSRIKTKIYKSYDYERLEVFKSLIDCGVQKDSLILTRTEHLFNASPKIISFLLEKNVPIERLISAEAFINNLQKTQGHKYMSKKSKQYFLDNFKSAVVKKVDAMASHHRTDWLKRGLQELSKVKEGDLKDQMIDFCKITLEKSLIENSTPPASPQSCEITKKPILKI